MQPLALYIHWPFCLKKCPYCDFNSHVREQVDQAAWLAALKGEMQHYAKQMPGRQLTSIFFGGGTPSLMPVETVAGLIDAAGKLWSFADDIEITLEANPTSIEADKFKGFRSGGVNRVSIGVQSLRPNVLRFLGREHSADQARRAIQLAAEIFPRYSFDLIYARPMQSLDEWRAELEEGLRLASGHLSLYQLTIEPGTHFATLYRRGELAMPSDDLAADLYTLTNQMCAQVGMQAYEVSNYAMPGQESQHNLAYWQYRDYVGIGPGAHGRVTIDSKRYSTQMIKAPELWLEAANKDGVGLKEQVELDVKTQAIEAVLMGLRLNEGVDLKRIASVLEAPWQTVVDVAAVEELAADDWLILQKEYLAVTDKGRLLLNHVLEKIIIAGE